MNKSHFTENPLLRYCIEHGPKLHPVQQKLIEETLKHPMKIMLGATEVIQTCTVLMKVINAKKALDVGTFTGFSALSWALALPQDGRVVTMDVQDKDYKNIGLRFIQEAGVAYKIDLRIQPALNTLDNLISAGESGTFDFAFLDADKNEYPQYYEKCLQLLRPGGFIAVDNALGFGEITTIDTRDPNAMFPQFSNTTYGQVRGMVKSIDSLNNIIMNDDRVHSIMFPIGDGLHLAFKK